MIRIKTGPAMIAVGTALGIIGASLILRPTPAQAILTSAEQLLAQQRAQQGLKIAPVPLKMDGLDPYMVGYGSYLVNALGGCSDCHTNPTYLDSGDPFKGMTAKVNTAGYLGGGQEFGPFKSRNLTPEPEKGNLPAGMTFDQFTTVMRTGIDMDKKHPDMGPLLQVMPWPAFSQLTDYELRAMYEYLKAVPPVSVSDAK